MIKWQQLYNVHWLYGILITHQHPSSLFLWPLHPDFSGLAVTATGHRISRRIFCVNSTPVFVFSKKYFIKPTCCEVNDAYPLKCVSNRVGKRLVLILHSAITPHRAAWYAPVGGKYCNTVIPFLFYQQYENDAGSNGLWPIKLMPVIKLHSLKDLGQNCR